MRVTVQGLIIKQTIVRESDKFLTVLTDNFGKISVYAPHVRNIKRGSLPYTLPFQYCRLILNKKTETYTLCEGDVLYSFLKLQDDLDKFALAQYIFELVGELSVEGEICTDILRLSLNTLYILMQDTKPFEQIKATFELRALALSGYLPDISHCRYCNRNESEIMFFDIMNGSVTCRECQKIRSSSEKAESIELGTAVIIYQLSVAVLNAMRFILSAPDKKIFSIDFEKEVLDDLSSVCEKYVLNHLERGFYSLDFYHEVVGMN